jgi:hypothetical protein
MTPATFPHRLLRPKRRILPNSAVWRQGHSDTPAQRLRAPFEIYRAYQSKTIFHRCQRTHLRDGTSIVAVPSTSLVTGARPVAEMVEDITPNSRSALPAPHFTSLEKYSHSIVLVQHDYDVQNIFDQFRLLAQCGR